MYYKKTLRKVCVGFVVLMLMLTFFSQTLADLRTPQVTLAFRQAGVISPVAHTTGIVQPANTKIIFSPVDGIIVQMADLHEQVSNNYPLFTIRSDLRRLQEMLDQARDEQRLVALNIERVNNERALEQQRMNQLAARRPVVTALAEYDFQLVSNANQLEIAGRELAEQEALFAQGLVARQVVTEKEDALQSLELKRIEILARRSHAEEVQAGLLEEQRQDRDAQLQMQQGLINQLDVQLRMHAAEAEGIQRRINEIISQMEEGGLVEVFPETTHTVIEIMQGLAVGARIGEGLPVMYTAAQDFRFVIEVPFSQSQNFIRVGANAVIQVGEDNIEANVERVFMEQGQPIARISFASIQVSGGERANVRIEGPTRGFPQVIPRSALRRDATGYFILTVEAEERLFGVNYYAAIVRVEDVAARDDRFAAVVIQGVGRITGADEDAAPIIVSSDMPVYAQERVRPVDSGDFLVFR